MQAAAAGGKQFLFLKAVLVPQPAKKDPGLLLLLWHK